jgi:hypothetical protein
MKIIKILFKIWIMCYIIYTPFYVFIFDSAEDKVIDVSLFELIRLENKLIDERPEQTKIIDKVYKKGAEDIEEATRIDITISLNKALKRNPQIHSIKYTSNDFHGLTTVTINFIHEKYGNMTITGHATTPSFFKVEPSIFVGFNKAMSSFLASVVYGFDNNNIKVFNAFICHITPRLPY